MQKITLKLLYSDSFFNLSEMHFTIKLFDKLKLHELFQKVN
jgi:hypothetical protein